VFRILGVIRLALAALVTALVLSSCGGSNGTSESSSGSGATSSNSDVQQLQQRIDDAKQVPAFTYAGKPLDARAIANGKSVVNVPWGTAVDYPVLIANQMARAAAEVGLNWQTASVAGPDQWAQAMENAVAADPSHN
jgi:outer membrane biogenesis lipoprotein LolB